MKKLPKKPSKLIKVALKDLKKVEKDPIYAVDMGVWHEPETEEKPFCTVCLAGSVMSKTLNTPESFHVMPADFPADIGLKLDIIDGLRVGMVLFSSLKMLGLEVPSTLETSHSITPYVYSPKAFKKDMKKMAKYLKSQGL